MTIELRLTTLPESVTEANILSWYKKPGENVKQDEKLADIETDKVILDIPSPVAGVLTKIITPEGTLIQADTIIGLIEEGDTASIESPDTKQNPVLVPDNDQAIPLSPAVRNMLNELNLNAADIKATGKKGRILKSDVLNHVEKKSAPAQSEQESEQRQEPDTSSADSETISYPPTNKREPRRVPMSRIRSSIARRLVEAQHNSAILTTFNEVDLTEVMAIRTEFGEAFIKRHDVKLGFMSFFVKAVTEALKLFPIINAATEDNDILYHDFYDIGIAVGSERGLVVPILRDADQMSFARIESQIAAYAKKARDGSIAIEDITGGSFSITNGGVFGSLLSTPILNPPQSAILGLHKIQRRPVAIGDEIKIRPMMNLALSYDHRIIDGSDAVRFLVSIKEKLEKPASILLEL